MRAAGLAVVSEGRVDDPACWKFARGRRRLSDQRLGERGSSEYRCAGLSVVESSWVFGEEIREGLANEIGVGDIFDDAVLLPQSGQRVMSMSGSFRAGYPASREDPRRPSQQERTVDRDLRSTQEKKIADYSPLLPVKVTRSGFYAMKGLLPLLRKSQTPLTSMVKHEAALQALCEMAMEQLHARGITEPADIEEEPLPQSTIDLLRRTPRS